MKIGYALFSFLIFLTNPGISSAQEKWTCFTDDKVLLMDDYNTLGVFEYMDGSLWMITQRGINIFDGESWKRIDNRSDKMQRNISSYLVDSKNRIWVGSTKDVYYGPSFLHTYNDGVTIFDGTDWKSARTVDLGYKAPVVTRMYEANNGDIWLGVSTHVSGAETSSALSKGALLRLSNEEWTVYKGKDMPCLSCEFVKGFFEDDNGRLYFIAANGLYYFENDKFYAVKKDEGYAISSRVVTVKFKDSKNNLWLAAPARIAKFDGENWKTYNRKNGLPERTWGPLGFIETANNQVLLSMGNGLYNLDENDQWKRENKQFLSGNSYIDDQNRIWIPTFKGLVIKEGEESRLHKDIAKVWTVLRDKNGGEWALSSVDGASRYKDGQWQSFTKDNELPSNKVLAGYVANDGKVWIATSKGICKCEY